MLDVVFDDFSVDLQRQHEVSEGRFCEANALPRLEDLFKLSVLSLRPFKIMGLFVADGLQETELILDVELHVLDDVTVASVCLLLFCWGLGCSFLAVSIIVSTIGSGGAGVDAFSGVPCRRQAAPFLVVVVAQARSSV